jgi:hypothetical protein
MSAEASGATVRGHVTHSVCLDKPKKQPDLPAEGATMANDEWFILGDGDQPVGPFTVERIRRSYEAGQIPPGTQVSQPGSSRWIDVGEVLGLAGAGGPSQAALPPAPQRSAAPVGPVAGGGTGKKIVLTTLACLVIAIIGGMVTVRWAFGVPSGPFSDRQADLYGSKKTDTLLCEEAIFGRVRCVTKNNREGAKAAAFICKSNDTSVLTDCTSMGDVTLPTPSPSK